MDFQFRHHNRMVYPQKHLMVVEDIIGNQKRVLDHFADIFESDGLVQISLVPGALAAASIIKSCKIDLIILDHDLPEGNGSDLLIWMKNNNINIPVITFSGIPYNNAHMGNLGAEYIYGKEDVISGKVDNIIKSILQIEVKEDKLNIAEHVINTLDPFKIIMPRYWVNSNIMLGGAINDAADWEHLKNDFGIKAVINVDGNSDISKNIDNLLELPVEDNGNPFPKENIFEAVQFASEQKGPIYVHCWLGRSRSPHFVYAILRHNYKLSKEEAIQKLKAVMPPEHEWAFKQHTDSYINSIEGTISNL